MSLSQTFLAEGEGNRGFLRRRWNRRLLACIQRFGRSRTPHNRATIVGCNCPSCQANPFVRVWLKRVGALGGVVIIANEIRGLFVVLAVGPSMLSSVWSLGQ